MPIRGVTPVATDPMVDLVGRLKALEDAVATLGGGGSAMPSAKFVKSANQGIGNFLTPALVWDDGTAGLTVDTYVLLTQPAKTTVTITVAGLYALSVYVQVDASAAQGMTVNLTKNGTVGNLGTDAVLKVTTSSAMPVGNVFAIERLVVGDALTVNVGNLHASNTVTVQAGSVFSVRRIG